MNLPHVVYLSDKKNLSLFLNVQYWFKTSGTPGYRNGTESFFGLKGHPSVVRDA
jgi:hypothetical protein